MVSSGALGKYKPEPPSTAKYAALVAAVFAFGGGCGYMAGVQPSGAGWRFFSWHPFLMTFGLVTMYSTAFLTRKRLGYLNTKLHGMIGMAGNCMALGGMYVIYQNKERMGKEHLTTTHGQVGATVMICCMIVGMVGGIFLHPDFGIDKLNKTYRLAHTWFGRFITMLAWITAFLGLNELTQDPTTLLLYSVPLVIFFPLAVM